MTEPSLSGTLVSGLNLRKGRVIDDDNWAPYVVVALLERNDYDTLLAKQQLDPHSFLYNYQRVYPQRRNTYRTDPPKEQSETEIKWADQDFTFPISTKTEQEILIELWNARPSAPKDELLGEARIGLRSLFVTNADGGEKWLTLKKRPVGGTDGGTPGGQFLLTFKLNAPKLTYDVDLAMLFPGFQCSVININDYISDEALEKMGQEKRKRQKVLFEIINTEKSYVRDLYMLNQLFVVKLREKEILTREEISSIFANIPTLQDMHLELFKTLEALLEKDRSKTEEEIIANGVMNDGLGDIFLSRANLFKHYAAFCSNHINIGVKIKALQNQKPAFAEFLDEAFKLPESRGLPIDSFLISPLQRMVKYPLLLDTLIKATSDEHHDYATIKQALLEIKSVVDQVNKRTRQEARVKRMLDLQNQILHGETFNFLDRNRHVVKEGMAKVAGKETYLILFNDVLAFTRKKKDKFDVKAVIQLKGKKWAFLTVVPSFKTSGSTIRKKDMNDPVLVMIPEEDFVDSPFPTITVSASGEVAPSPESSRGASGDLTSYAPQSSPRSTPSPSSSSSHAPSPVSSSSASMAATPSPPSSNPPPPSSSAGTSATPSPPSFTKAASSGSLPMVTAVSPPLTPHASGTQSAAMPAVSTATAPSMRNLPETNSNSNQFSEGGIYKFFFKTVEERNEWMSKFRKVAGMAALAAPAPFTAPTATAATLAPPAATGGDQSPKKSLTEMVKQKDSRRSRIRSVSATVTLPPIKPETASSNSPPPSTAGSPGGSPSPLVRNGSDSARAASTSPRGEAAAAPSPSSGEKAKAAVATATAAATAAAEREAAVQQALNERNTEINEIRKKLEHEEALRKEVQLTCQTLQKKIVDTERDKAEKIKAEKESSEFLKAEVMRKLHDIEKELSEEREERKRERESRHKLEDKLDKMWDSLLIAIRKSNSVSNGERPQLFFKGLDDAVAVDDEDDSGHRAQTKKSGSKSENEQEDSELVSPRSRRRKESPSAARLQAADTESDGSDMSGSGSDIATQSGGKQPGTPTSARTRASTSSASEKKAQWRKSLWWGNKNPQPAASGSKSNPGSPVPTKGKGSATNASLENMPRRDSEADSEGSERDDSRDIKRKQMEKTSSWRSKKNTASLPRTLSHGSMEKEKQEVKKKDSKKETKLKEKERKEEEKKQLQLQKEKEKEKKSSGKRKSGKLEQGGSSIDGQQQQQPMQRASSLPDEADAAAALALDDEHDEQEEWEIDPKDEKKKKDKGKKKTTTPSKQQQKTHDEKDDSDASSSDNGDDHGDEGDNNGDDLLVGSPRSKKDDKMRKAGSNRSLSRSADAVATKKVAKHN